MSCCSGRNAASRIATWSALSFCHSPISRISRWVALFSLVRDWNRLSWFSSIASARAIICRNHQLRLGAISQLLGPPRITVGSFLFSFQTARGALSPQTQAILSNKRVIIHLFTSFCEKYAQSNSRSIWPGDKKSPCNQLNGDIVQCRFTTVTFYNI